MSACPASEHGIHSWQRDSDERGPFWQCGECGEGAAERPPASLSVPDSVRCPVCSVSASLEDFEPVEAVMEAWDVQAHGCLACRCEGRVVA